MITYDLGYPFGHFGYSLLFSRQGSRRSREVLDSVYAVFSSN